MENAWISIGYNVAGFTDKDFSNANYTAQGPYIQYRFKFDQNSVKEGLKALGQVVPSHVYLLLPLTILVSSRSSAEANFCRSVILNCAGPP